MQKATDKKMFEQAWTAHINQLKLLVPSLLAGKGEQNVKGMELARELNDIALRLHDIVKFASQVTYEEGKTQ